jgi:hypothetical protein
MPSTVIDHFSFDPETGILRVTFISGTVYEYKDVPVKIFERMKNSISKGKFLNSNIKGKFPFKKLA